MCFRQNMGEWQPGETQSKISTKRLSVSVWIHKRHRNMWWAFSCWATGTPQQSYLSKHCKLINHWRTQRDCICWEMLSRLRGDQSVSIAIFSRGTCATSARQINKSRRMRLYTNEWACKGGTESVAKSPDGKGERGIEGDVRENPTPSPPALGQRWWDLGRVNGTYQ